MIRGWKVRGVWLIQDIRRFADSIHISMNELAGSLIYGYA